jgi:hypothetical protein
MGILPMSITGVPPVEFGPTSAPAPAWGWPCYGGAQLC